MDNDDLGLIGSLIMVVCGLSFFLGDHADKQWPYLLGGALFGLLLVVLGRLLPERNND